MRTRRLSRLLRTPTLGSIAAGIVGQAAIMASGVITARILGVEDRGYLALVVLLPIVLSHALTLGIPLAVTFRIARDPGIARRVVRSIALVALWQLAVLMVALAAVVAIVFNGAPRHVLSAAVLATASAPLLLAQHYGLAVLQGQHRFLALSLLRALPVLLYSVALAAVVLAAEPNLVGIVALWLAGHAVATAVWGASVLRGLRAAGDPGSEPSRRELLRFGLRGMIGSFSPVETFRLDQLVVGLVLSPVALGLYVVGLAFTALPRLVSFSIGLIMYPRVAAEADAGRATAIVWRSFGLCALFIGVFVAGLEVVAPSMIRFFFGDEFAGAGTATRILLVSALFFSLRRVLIEGAQGVGLPALGTWSELVSWVVFAPVLIILVPRWGIEGMATGVAAGSAAGFGFIALAMSPWFVKRVHIAS